ncbi:MAG: hypothetical protein Aurels2KO_15680 [Aureliella sp.]
MGTVRAGKAMTTKQCLSRGQLKEYLSGWADGEIAEQIELHLADCADCEQTVVSLESEPDTLIVFARGESSSGSDEAGAVDSPIAQAMRAAKLHVPSGDSRQQDVSAEPANVWPMLGHEIAGYELLRPLGRGGMGTVYVAKHRKLGKEVAIKLLPAEAFRDKHFASRFEREMRAAGGLEHASIVRATDAGEDGGVHYLAMELVDGLDLSRIVRLAGRLEIADACELGRQIALGLAHAHAAGVVHRDIKPSNIVVSRDGVAKLLDFGLARTELWDEVSVELTTVGQLMGTIDYMAPEQAERPEAVDYRADLYALGATLFRLLAGRSPLSISPSLSPLSKLRLLAMHEPPSIDTLRDDVPSELVALISELLARSPDGRPASADHVAQRLAQLGQGSDLSKLVTFAVEQAESETDFDVSPIASLVSSSATAVSLAEEPKAADAITPNDASGRGSIFAWGLTAASVLALAVAGVLFTLETQKGQLIVESDVPGVTVQIKQGGKVARELTVEGGAESTRLWAGKYEVVLGAGSDSVQIVDGSVLVMRGETKIARVQLKEKENSAAQIESRSAPPAAASVLIPGDTLRISSLSDSALNARQIKVMGDSTVKLPMVGVVSVEGKNIEALEQELNQLYTKFVRNPGVEVFRDELTRPFVSGLTHASGGRVVPPASTAPLQPGDALTISSLREKDIACRVVVQADHTIKPKMVGVVSVKGKTVDQLERDLEVRYSKYLKAPAVEVFRDFTLVGSSWAPISKPAVSQTSSLASQKASDEPMYDSRTLSEWLELLRRERSPSALYDVFTALDALAGKSTAKRITDVVLEVVPNREGSMTVYRDDNYSSLDLRSFKLLLRANPGKAYFDLLLSVLSSTGDMQWKKRIISRGLLFTRQDVDAIADLNRWIVDNVLIGSGDNDLRKEAIWAYRDNARLVGVNADAASMLIEALSTTTHDDLALWINYFPRGSWSIEQGSRLTLPKAEVYWNSQWGKKVAAEALNVLQAQTPKRAQLIQAERILHFLCVANRDEEFGIDRKLIRSFLKKRVNQLPIDELLSTTELYGRFCTSYPDTPKLMELGALRVVWNNESLNTDVETLALIELAHATLTREENQEFLSDVLSRIEIYLFDMNFDASPESYSIPSRKIRAKVEFPDFKDLRNEMPYASPERWIALMIACRIYDGLEKESRDAFELRESLAQRQRWFASKVGGKGSEPKPLAITFERAKESLSEILHSADARSGVGVEWEELCQEADKNGDSKLDADEYVSLYNRLRSLPTAEDSPHLQWAKRMIAKVDRNGDGVLTKDEWNNLIVKPIKADYDNDGIITADEYARYRQGS